MGFLSGKILDSVIIGIICYIVCSILQMPYTLLISVIIGVTNIIPFFGPLIGAVPSALIILMVDPTKCLIFIVFIIILQQIDGNIIGPRILGEKMGISDFWVLVSITVFGAAFGFPGMILGVPIFTIFSTLVSESVRKTLRKKELPEETKAYYSILAVEDLTKHEMEFGEATVFQSGDSFETEYDPDEDFEYDDPGE